MSAAEEWGLQGIDQRLGIMLIREGRSRLGEDNSREERLQQS